MKERFGSVSVQYWQEVIDDGKGAYDSGWYCWVYVNDNTDFPGWMDKYCPTAEYTFRFNSGDPMYTVNITNEKEAMLFSLQWIK